MAGPNNDLLLQAQSGDANAQYTLGNAYHFGAGVSKQLPVAMRWYLKAAAQGHRDAQVNLGLMYLQELPQAGMAGNPTQARYWFRRAAESGDGQAMFYLANCHLLGNGAPVDLYEVERWYRAAAEQGLVTAQYHLGLLLLAGQGRTPDPTQGMHWLTRAADQGMAAAQYELARQLRGGPGVESDPLMMLHYLHEAADQDHVQAMYALALQLERGDGLDRAYPEQAAQWYRKLAQDHDHGPAAHNLGILYVEGRGVEQNADAALDMFQLAVALNCNEAMYSLALLHCAGGTARDFEAAATWSILSQAYCPERGGAVLLAGIARRLEAGQLESAHRAAEDWKRQMNRDRAEQASADTLAETI